MSKTPTKNDTSHNFKPKEIATPTKDFPGVSRTVYTHVSNLHGLLLDWKRVQDRGAKLCKSIASFKLYECCEDYYPREFTPLTENLVETLASLRNVLKGCELISTQLEALVQLQMADQPLILTWSAALISKSVGSILHSLEKEYRLKAVITENVAHCRDKAMVEVYSTSWSQDVYLKVDLTSYLFAEVGLPALPSN